MRLKVPRSRHRMSKHHQTEARYKYRLDRRWPLPGRPCSRDSAAQLSPSHPWYHPLVCLQEWRQILANMPPFASLEQVSVELTCSTFSEFELNHWRQWGPFSVMPWPPLWTILYKLWRKILKTLLRQNGLNAWAEQTSSWPPCCREWARCCQTQTPRCHCCLTERLLRLSHRIALPAARHCRQLTTGGVPAPAPSERSRTASSPAPFVGSSPNTYFLTVIAKLLYFPPQIRHQESRIDGFCRDELFLTSVSELTGAEPQALFRTHNWKLILSNKWIPGAAWLKPFLSSRD